MDDTMPPAGAQPWPAPTGQPWPAPTGQPWPAPTGQPWAPPAGRPWPGPAGQPEPETRRRGRIGGGLAALGAFLAKYGVLLYKLKYVTVMASMLVSVAAYALLWGWTFAAGFVLLLFVHEMGHALEMRRQGIPASAPMFIPFMGAVISMRGRAASAYEEARIGLAGPAFGAAASAVVGFYGSYRNSDFLRALAFIGFFLNLFNLFPVLPLDGGRAVGALHPAIWLAGLVGLVGFEIWRPSPVMVLIIVLGGVELWRRWKGRNSAASRIYHDLRAAQRAAIGLAYVSLVAVCLVGMNATYLVRHIN